MLGVMAAMALFLVYGWWRVMRWLGRRPLEPDRRAHAKLCMWLALITGVINVTATQLAGDLDAYSWMGLPHILACGTAATVIAGGATGAEIAKYAPLARMIAILVAGSVVVEWVVFGFWLTPPPAS
jgi:hypothetical protein